MRGLAVATLFLLAVLLAVSIDETDARYYYWGHYWGCWRWRTRLSNCLYNKKACQYDLKFCQEELAEIKEELKTCEPNLTMCMSDLEMAMENLTMCEEQLMPVQENLTECQMTLENCTEAIENITSVCDSTTCGDHGECLIGPGLQPVCVCDPGYCGRPCEPSTESTGSTCSDTTPCTTSGSVCVEGQCVCECGSVYVPDLFFEDASRTRDACVRDCPNGVSGTFVRFPNRMIGNDDGKRVPNVASIDACEALCVAETDFVCRSYEYRASTNACTLNLAGKDDPIRFIPSPQKDFGQRVCL